MSELTTRERIAMRILALMFEIVAPNQKYKHINGKMMDEIFAELTGDKDE
jgi:hypothetical protein